MNSALKLQLVVEVYLFLLILDILIVLHIVIIVFLLFSILGVSIFYIVIYLTSYLRFFLL
jgi:hypothetical protein